MKSMRDFSIFMCSHFVLISCLYPTPAGFVQYVLSKQMRLSSHSVRDKSDCESKLGSSFLNWSGCVTSIDLKGHPTKAILVKDAKQNFNRVRVEEIGDCVLRKMIETEIIRISAWFASSDQPNDPEDESTPASSDGPQIELRGSSSI